MQSRASVEKFPGETMEKRPKNSTIKPLPGGEWKNRLKNSKKDQIALLSLYLLYLFHV